MRQIINGRMYNTETAKEIAYYWNGYATSDFKNETTRLYRKKTGEYFFYIIGGAMSSAAEWHGNYCTGGEKIVPTTEAEAREFCEENLPVDEYVSIFGEPAE